MDHKKMSFDDLRNVPLDEEDDEEGRRLVDKYKAKKEAKMSKTDDEIHRLETICTW